MFGFLKEKLKSAIAKFSKDVDREAKVVEEKVVERAVKKKEKAKPEKKEKKQKPQPKAKERPKEKAKPGKKEKRSKKPEEEAQEIPEEVEEKPEEIEEKVEEEVPKNIEVFKVLTNEEAEEKAEPEKKGFFSRLKDKFTKKEEAEVQAEKAEEETGEEEREEETGEETEEEPEEEAAEEEKPKEKKGFFEKIRETVTTKTLSDAKFEEIFWDLEVALLENNVAVEVIAKIKDDLRKKLVDQKLQRSQIDDIIGKTLYGSISSLFDVGKIDLADRIRHKRPLVVVFVGVNGSGKTTTIAKVARLMQDKKFKPVIAAADTFRAAAIQQLEEHGGKLGVKVIKHDYGSDPAAVAFDAIKYAEAKHLDIVLIDTAGRQHSNTNLMEEMKKIVRVAKPDLKIFIGESITGNDCIEQAKQFNDAVGIDGIILTKADVDDKGGAAVSVSYVTGKPILFIGMGQGYEDLKEFDKKMIMENIGLG
ncbi:signal recognition particle-docking protein FtsY [Candidatus Woesearchaeota archaeon CG10_big_fil_rev_8_21_14_0_10_44_13]|nr:MAG: signal recognition particle-docking protein FtsY [Candidatus Woesearchaeota archaeon CG10_big_fil_rev_8_21_14_0_10_44_13]